MHRRIPFVVAFAAAALALIFVFVLRMPLPFSGFSAIAAAVLAGIATLAVLAWLPVRWLWSDAELLRMAFQARHNLTALGSENALKAVTLAHAQADLIRDASGAFLPALRTEVEEAADRLDAGAREIFYSPDRLRALQPIMARADLIVEAVQVHSALRGKGDETLVEESRSALRTALDALDAAFTESDLRAARGLLDQVEAASEIADLLLAPRRPSPK